MPHGIAGEEPMSDLKTWKQSYAKGRLSRRQFMQGAMAMGMTVAAATAFTD